MAGIGLAIAGLALSAAGTTANFIGAAQANKEAKKADREADKALADARKRLSVNYLEGLSLPMEAYELEREALLSQGATALQAATEGSARGAAATAGRIQAAQQQGQRNIAARTGQALYKLQAAVAQEDKRLAGLNTGLDLRELEGQQAASQEARLRANEQAAAGMAGLGQTLQGVGNLLPDQPKTAAGKAAAKVQRQYQRAQRRGDIGSDVSLGEFANINMPSSGTPSVDLGVDTSMQGMISSVNPMYGRQFGDPFADPLAYTPNLPSADAISIPTLSSDQYAQFAGQMPGFSNFGGTAPIQDIDQAVTFFEGLTPYEQRQYFRNRRGN